MTVMININEQKSVIPAGGNEHLYPVPVILSCRIYLDLIDTQRKYSQTRDLKLIYKDNKNSEIVQDEVYITHKHREPYIYFVIF